MRGLAVLVAASLAACGHGLPPRPEEPPPVPQVAAGAPEASPQTLASGLRVVDVPPREGVFSAAILFPGGPLHDPTTLPGLTEFMAEAATLGTWGDPDDATPPHRRALRHGGELLVVADGRRLGWAVIGPPEASDDLLRLLVDVATRPAFPATRLQLRATLLREHIEARGEQAVSGALALAVGLALGNAAPLPLSPTVDMLSTVNREDVLRHWRGIARPDRGVLVVSGAPLPAREAASSRLADWHAEGSPAPVPPPCIPQGHAAHLVVAEDIPSTRAIMLVGVAAVPGARREALEALLAWFGRVPSGPVAEQVGPDDALRAAPELIDLGLWGRRRVAVLLGGLGGDRDEVVEHMTAVAERLARYASEPGLLGDAEARDAVRMVRGSAATTEALPLRRLLAAAGRALPDPTAPGPDDAGTLHEAAAAHLAPHRYAYVVLGPPELEATLGELAPVTVWDADGTLVRGPGPPRCLPVSPTISGRFSVDRHPARR